MSDDGDLVRIQLTWAPAADRREAALAALARLEAAAGLQEETKRANELLVRLHKDAEAQRDALAEALRKDMHVPSPAVRPKRRWP